MVQLAAHKDAHPYIVERQLKLGPWSNSFLQMRISSRPALQKKAIRAEFNGAG
jgi:hypothetical protein